MNWPSHGSNPHYVYEYMDLPMPERILDFSVNLNPFGPPETVKQQWNNWLPAIMDYPDPGGRQLVRNIADKEELLESSILLGNGGAELITLLARRFAGKNVLLIQPTFSEYERTCKAHGCHISHFILPENDWRLPLKELKQQLTDIDLVFFCHPNNPTGISYSRNERTRLVQLCAEQESYLVIDEAFYDFQPQPESMADLVEQNSYVIILRSLTKMYAIAGLRLGYLLASPTMIEQLSRYRPHWSINSIALLAGAACLQEEKYVYRTQNYISYERERMLKALRGAGFIVSESCVNFYLVRDPELDTQRSLFRYLLKQGLVPRHTENYHGLNGRWLRFSIKTKEQNDKLLEALVRWKDMD